ncbi:MAG: hypothetical protein IKX45_06040 [Bacteroidales bacterium]|nr:hypothetical protein [Bacteroidales bacterium]
MNIFKPIALTLMTALILTSSATPKDKDDHTLVALWKEYYAAESADKPKTQENVLEKIKAEAKTKHLTWDFYDAAVKLAQVRTIGNWKLRETENAARDKDIIEFGEPVAEFMLKDKYTSWDNTWQFKSRQKKQKEFVEANAKQLKAAHNPEFYKQEFQYNPNYFGLLPDLLKNDYQFCLFVINDPKQLIAEFKAYPLSAFAEFLDIEQYYHDIEKFKPACDSFIKKWDGKAAALLAEGALLEARFNELTTRENEVMKGSSADFKALDDDIKAFEKRRAEFKGEEKKIADRCTGAKELAEMLNDKGISIDINDGKLTISLRNLETATAQILKGKEKVWEKKISNPAKSFYVEDKISLDLPDFADDTYSVKCFQGKTSAETEYQKYTISASFRKSSSGIGVWATDFISGKPLEKVKVELIKEEKVLESANLTLEGYTPLPASISHRLGERNNNYQLRVRCSDGRERASRLATVYAWQDKPESDEPDRMNAVLLTDRSAYNPDETVHFKAVLYKGKQQLKGVGKGTSVTVELLDTKRKLIESKKLSTNEFGSVAGEFLLKRSSQNGWYYLTVKHGDKHLITREIRVDDFVLPTFDLVFDTEASFKRPISEIKTGGTIYAYSGHSLASSRIEYTVKHHGDEYASGQLSPDKDGRFDITFPVDSTMNSSRYDWYYLTVKVTDATGETMEWKKNYTVNSNETTQPSEYFFKDKEGLKESISVKVVAGDKPVWMVVEAFGPDSKLLWKRMERFAPGDGPASMTFDYKMKASDPEAMTLRFIYFQNKKSYSHSCHLQKEDHTYDLPLEFSRFLDTTAPGASYTFGIKTLAGVECAASVFDVSTERITRNAWRTARATRPSAPYISSYDICGIDASSHRIYVRGLVGASGRVMSKAASNMVMMDSAVPESAEAEEAIPFQLVEEKPQPTPDIPIRENFANTIAWEPFLRSDKAGNISFSFTNADKLSTYYVQLFAHDKAMRNTTLRREMVVTIPVKISLAEPQFLYEGDKYIARIALSSASDKDTKGTLTVQLLDGSDHKTAPVLRTASCEMLVPAKASATQDFVMEVPAVANLGIKAMFIPEGDFGSDGIFVCVPVKKAVQTLTEAHSAVLLSGDDKAALEKKLRAMFENVEGSVPALEEIDIRQMLRDALPSELEPRCDNAISLARAIYAYELCRRLNLEPKFDRDEAVKKLLACRNADGGFAWFAEMSSSPLVTAIVLRLVHGLGVVDEAAAVHYIDKEFFRKDKAGWWYRGLSIQQYLHTRSLFPEVSFQEKTDADFRKDARAYLVPKKERGLNGWIAAKARRVQTLENFLSKDGGTALASKLGIKLGTARKLRKSLAADIESLVEYAQPHKSGGVYYPNAVMPWRGLLETELDAHCALAQIMDEHGHFDISNGIRLWIMLQKETQDWKQDPGYVEALGMVLNGPEEVLDTKVLALKAEYTLPFDQIRAAGNGMGIVRQTLPDVVKIGDRVKLSYTITNEENRSFVKVTIPFGAGLVPVNQMSGYRWGYYRNVLQDRIECWYEVYPEEKTTVSEEFYVTRAGSFQAPVATIECEYAPHYRANDAWNGRMEISAK